ncbi:PIN domain-like protein [Panaeolus papilionaceus]|nr:PIN domain-like protein [Panaeolus papilionaceus]
MGVSNLWKTVKPAGETLPLTEIALRLPLHGERNAPCIGIDMSPLMDECIAATMPQGVNGRLPGGPLYIFFHKLVAFLGVRATFVFVFDGPERPSIKRGHKVHHQNWWTGIAEELIIAFGFQVHHAPGEAEAELAMLNCHTVIDAVMTTDSDVLVFGANHIIWPISGMVRKVRGCSRDEFEIYTSERVQQLAYLSRAGLILFALLSGGDYDDGIRQCGPKVALGLACSGYGDQLYAALGLEEREFERFICTQWRESICDELRTNANGHLPSKQPHLAASLEESLAFPDRGLLQLYVSPVVSATMPSSTSHWDLIREPSLVRIRNFCQQQLRWTEEHVIQQKFNSVVFPAVVSRMLYIPLKVYKSSEKKLMGPTLQVTIASVKRKPRQGHHLAHRHQNTQLQVETSPLFRVMNYHTFASNIITISVPHDVLPAELQCHHRHRSPSPYISLRSPEIIDLTVDESNDGPSESETSSNLIDLTTTT